MSDNTAKKLEETDSAEQAPKVKAPAKSPKKKLKLVENHNLKHEKAKTLRQNKRHVVSFCKFLFKKGVINRMPSPKKLKELAQSKQKFSKKKNLPAGELTKIAQSLGLK